MSKILRDGQLSETKDYFLTFFVDKEEPKDSAYVIINKNTGIWEIISSILPQALGYIQDLQVGLDAIEAGSAEPKGKPGEVVSIFPDGRIE